MWSKCPACKRPLKEIPTSSGIWQCPQQGKRWHQARMAKLLKSGSIRRMYLRGINELS